MMPLPSLVVTMLPWSMILQSKRNYINLCTQQYQTQSHRHVVEHEFFGLCQTEQNTQASVSLHFNITANDLWQLFLPMQSCALNLYLSPWLEFGCWQSKLCMRAVKFQGSCNAQILTDGQRREVRLGESLSTLETCPRAPHFIWQCSEITQWQLIYRIQSCSYTQLLAWDNHEIWQQSGIKTYAVKIQTVPCAYLCNNMIVKSLPWAPHRNQAE